MDLGKADVNVIAARVAEGTLELGEIPMDRRKLIEVKAEAIKKAERAAALAAKKKAAKKKGQQKNASKK